MIATQSSRYPRQPDSFCVLRQRVTGQPWRETLGTWWPRLLPGVVIKFADTATDVYARTGNGDALAAAIRATRLIGR